LIASINQILELTTSVKFAPVAKSRLKTSNKEQPKAHEKGTTEKHGPSTPFVDVNDSGNWYKILSFNHGVRSIHTGEGNIEDILDRLAIQ
jgi:hypothetical protein